MTYSDVLWNKVVAHKPLHNKGVVVDRAGNLTNRAKIKIFTS
jgi:hypothetical protein